MQRGLLVDAFIVDNTILVLCVRHLEPQKFPTSSLKAWNFLLPPWTQTVFVTGANLCVGSGASQLIFSLLVIGLSLAPRLAALVPVVPRDACKWERGTET